MDESKLLDRVRKLLAQAEGAATEGEAEAFNEKAAELIARHGIDQALLAQAGEIRDEITHIRITIDNPYSGAKHDLLLHIASPLRCRTVRHSAGRNVTGTTVFGYSSDLERVEVLYTSLLLQMAHHVTQVRPERTGWDNESTRTYRLSWMQGFRTAVYRRLAAAEQRAARERDVAADSSSSTPGSGTELVLVGRTSQVDTAFDEFMVERFGRKLRNAPKRTYAGSGFHDGHEAGERAELGAMGVHGSRSRQIAD